MKYILEKIKNNTSFIILLVFLIITRTFLFEPFRIPSGSMEPTILVGDFIIVNKFIYGIKIPIFQVYLNVHEPERGDIIVFKKDNINYVKRIVALGNDHFFYKNDNIFLNNKQIKQKNINKFITLEIKNLIITAIHRKEFLNIDKYYTIKNYNSSIDIKYNFNDIIVPKGCYFVLGDNRDNSEDSRFWGFVKRESVIGKSFLVIFSFDKNLLDLRWERFFKKIK